MAHWSLFALGGGGFSLFLFLWESEKKMLFVRLGEDQKKNNDSVNFCHRKPKRAFCFVRLFYYGLKKKMMPFF